MLDMRIVKGFSHPFWAKDTILKNGDQTTGQLPLRNSTT
ncbi:hypothetical protein LINPERPRIM_LOCUS24926 [Linum perenne]